ncbi:UNVERIFIED_CONTAM: hypothetical protein FKN15_013809, partial [Acipenser sinensis]
EIALQQIMAHLDAIRKDMVILEKSEFANLRAENEEESMKIRADAKLDINLERSRVTDMFTEQEKKLMEVGTEFDKKCNGKSFHVTRNLKVGVNYQWISILLFQNADVDRSTTEATKKIDIEVASLKTLLESLKLDTIRYLAGKKVDTFKCLFIYAAIFLISVLLTLIKDTILSRLKCVKITSRLKIDNLTGNDM